MGQVMCQIMNSWPKATQLPSCYVAALPALSKVEGVEGPALSKVEGLGCQVHFVVAFRGFYRSPPAMSLVEWRTPQLPLRSPWAKEGLRARNSRCRFVSHLSVFSSQLSLSIRPGLTDGGFFTAQARETGARRGQSSAASRFLNRKTLTSSLFTSIIAPMGRGGPGKWQSAHRKYVTCWSIDMLMSSGDFEERRKLYEKAAKLRLYLSVLALLAYVGCLLWIVERWFVGVAETWGIWGVLAGAAPLTVGVAGWMWYLSYSFAALQRKYGLVCPNCHALIE